MIAASPAVSFAAAPSDFAEDFAVFSSNLTVGAIPPDVLDTVRRDIFDTLACATAGISADGVGALVDLLADWGGKPEAAIWCTGLRVPAHHAAWANGMMSHARDFDDTHDAAVLHAGVSVIPAAIAAAERDPAATGADLLAGVAAGLELICRLGVATKVGIIETGFMYTSLFGHFAATAAAARVLRLDPAQTTNALGIAYSQAAGTHQVTRDAALTKRMQPGFAAKTGLISALLSQAGVRGAQQTFEGEDGLVRSYFHGRMDTERLRDGLGQRFLLNDLSFKPYPCCRFNHTAIDAALSLRDRLGPGGVGGISRITALVNHQANEACGTPIAMRQNPKTIVQAQFSIPYTVACALVHGTVGLPEFTNAALGAPDVCDLARRVDVVVDPDIEREWGRNISPTLLRVETADGTLEARVDYPRGGTDLPMSRDDFDRKMDGCLRISGLSWGADAPHRLHDVIGRLGIDAAPRDLVACLTPDA